VNDLKVALSERLPLFKKYQKENILKNFGDDANVEQRSVLFAQSMGTLVTFLAGDKFTLFFNCLFI